ncbi:hypothetical protein KP509_01G129700 [Ceratopteris richardii]|uniref:RNase H type-1 domain-containing protein n=1 Tax=Ceratopteris richardii TaxID=49495 RepID=A0A8T2VPA0_CERRI|nr:hypothetical protein KP509_01G129700 [Ceratopteris richardii]
MEWKNVGMAMNLNRWFDDDAESAHDCGRLSTKTELIAIYLALKHIANEQILNRYVGEADGTFRRLTIWTDSKYALQNLKWKSRNHDSHPTLEDSTTQRKKKMIDDRIMDAVQTIMQVRIC